MNKASCRVWLKFTFHFIRREKYFQGSLRFRKSYERKKWLKLNLERNKERRKEGKKEESKKGRKGGEREGGKKGE
jgi:hypothetical protein